MTDVTGFGLFGHAMEMARGSDATIVLEAASVPLLPEAAELVRQGFFTGASVRNWASYGDGIKLDLDFPEWQRHLYTDPQTSGGLLIACDAAHAEAIARRIVDDGYPFARIIGRVGSGAPLVKLAD
jgi:selenide,water dikinase